jgi:hypothetical protein
MSFRNNFILLNVFFFLFSNNFPIKAEEELSPLEQLIEAEKQENSTNPTESLIEPTGVILKGSANRVLDRKSKINISLMTTLSSELNQVGDGVEAKILVSPNDKDNSLKALKGSHLIGHVLEVKRSRKAGRAGSVKVLFDTLKIQSGKTFPIKAEMTTETFKGKEAGKMVLYDAKLITLGALWGTYNSLKFAPVAAIYSQGLSVAASATIGASLGIIGSIRRKGDIKTFFAGEKSQIEFKNELNLTDDILNEAALSSKVLTNELIGLKLNLLNAQINDSEDYENILNVKVKVNNQTNSAIYPCDLLLIPKDGGDPIMADLRNSGLDLLKKIAPGKVLDLELIFPLAQKASLKDYNLALIDPLDKTYLSSIELENSVIKLNSENKNQI